MTMYPLRRFTPSGMSEFQRRWSIASEAGSILVVEDMLEDANWTQMITKDAVVEFREFASRRQCGEYFVELFSSVEESLKTESVDPAVSVELWAWLSAFWSEWLQQKDGGPVPGLRNGTRGEKARANGKETLLPPSSCGSVSNCCRKSRRHSKSTDPAVQRCRKSKHSVGGDYLRIGGSHFQ